MDGKKPLVLMILDGWGLREDTVANAVALGRTPTMDRLNSQYQHTELVCSGESVGLPAGQMGNSEVGHLNMGAGRVIYQELTRISKAIRDGDFFENQVLLAAMDKVRQQGTALHFIGLLSDGGVHSHIEHLLALVKMAKLKGLSRVYIHAFLDGRYVAPRSGLEFVRELERQLEFIGVGEVSTVSGRYYAMDRDNRWERVEKAYNALVLRDGFQAATATEGIQASYQQGVNDEFVLPFCVEQSSDVGIVQNDGVIFFNFRPDRAREISRALAEKEFPCFARSRATVENFVCLTEYNATFPFPVAFPPQKITQTLGEVLAQQELRQLRIAETEKYAHVTFFFNGGNEVPNKGEDRVLISSPKVATYNLQPQMSAFGVTNKVVELLEQDIYDVVIMNYANTDMVGHSGILQAAINAVEIVDECVGRVVALVLAKGGKVLITADHGNAEQMKELDSDEPYTAHTCNNVPFILVSEQDKNCQLRTDGMLADIAPTILDLLGIGQPKEMTGKSLVQSK